MRYHPLFGSLLIGLILFLFQTAVAEDASQQGGTACIRGTVLYRSSADATHIPYPHAKITAWRHGTKEGLTGTRADRRGRFCIEVPLGLEVDLRVWGLEEIGGTSFVCRGSANKVETGATAGTCGGDCIQVDIMTECTDQIPKRRRP